MLPFIASFNSSDCQENNRLILHTSIWSVDNTFICVVFQAAVPVNKINHVLSRSDRGHIDGQTLSMRTQWHVTKIHTKWPQILIH